MTSFANTWKGMALHSRIGLGVGTALIAGVAIATALWAYRADYQVLFSNVAPADAAAMSAELDRMKTPYQLGDGGNTILVPKDLVYKTRLKLMGKELPLHGAVGFEVFNNADFGMTEFVQKVNYLRAIQGELTRTILSIEEVQSARVHLAIPEQGLFKKALSKPKASVTLTMKPGKELTQDQIAGVQRLVAASVPDIVSADVTLLSQHGLALTRVAQAEDGAPSPGGQLDAKRGTEEYLVKKITQVLERTFGPGEAVASVDVVLNLDQSKLTTEEVLPAKNGAPDAVPAGVVVRERQSSREAGAGTAGGGSLLKSGATPGTSSSESDYQVGRRVEQVVTSGGTIKRMTIAVLVKQTLSEGQLEKLKEVVTLAIGFNSQRGDAVVVYSMDKFANTAALAATGHATATVELGKAEQMPLQVAVATESGVTRGREASLTALGVLALVLGTLAVVVLAVVLLRQRKKPAKDRLDATAREQLLKNIKLWIAEPANSGVPTGRSQ